MAMASVKLFEESGPFSTYYKGIKKQVSGDKLKNFVTLGKAEEQIKFLLDLQGVLDIKVEAAPSIKNLEKALSFKEEGNDHFRRNMFREAIQAYTKAIQYCPVDEGKPEDPKNRDYSIFFANRSAAMDGAGLYAACIHDIDVSLKFGYPKELWYKIYKRKGHAGVKLRQYLIAKDALEFALKNVGKSDIKKEKDRDNYRMRIRKQMTVFNVCKQLYNCEKFERSSTTVSGTEDRNTTISLKIRFVEDGNKKAIEVDDKDVKPEDILVALDPYVAVVNVSGGRAGGKICPHTMEKVFNPIPCNLGSEQLFCSFEARDEANKSYHQYEWSILRCLDEAKMLEKARLALRMVTNVNPDDIMKVSTTLGEHASSEVYARTLNLPLPNLSEDEILSSSLVSLFLTRCLSVSGYVKSPSKDIISAKLSQEQLEVYRILRQAVLVALHHTQQIKLYDVPKDKKGFLDEDVRTDVCGFAIYPDLQELESAGAGPECHAITWYAEKRLVITSFRTREKGQKICLVEDKSLKTKPVANDLITFRCANELCSCSFPLKENTKEKLISCPLDDCGIKTNIWERLKLIQRLKKDFSSAKEEFNKGDVDLAKDILISTIEEWDRIVVRPYREIEQLQEMLVKCLSCKLADEDRMLVEGNQFGQLVGGPKKKTNILPEDEDEEPIYSKMVEINKVK